MKLIIISGRSGSGKSTALNVLEDSGFYCIDNLPAGLLPTLIRQTKKKKSLTEQLLAVCIDARNHTEDIEQLPEVVQKLPRDVDTQVVYLDASSPVLIKRFSETRRKHPLSDTQVSLKEAIQKEKEMLRPISMIADLQINTNRLNVHELQNLIKKRLCSQLDAGGMSILFTSFGYKNGVPVDADIVFDVRCLPNPYWSGELRKLTGLDPSVQRFLRNKEDVAQMLADIRTFLERWLPKFKESHRSYVTIAIGCTGGIHRSVYISEMLKEYFSGSFEHVQIHHRELK